MSERGGARAESCVESGPDAPPENQQQPPPQPPAAPLQEQTPPPSPPPPPPQAEQQQQQQQQQPVADTLNTWPAALSVDLPEEEDVTAGSNQKIVDRKCSSCHQLVKYNRQKTLTNTFKTISLDIYCSKCSYLHRKKLQKEILDFEAQERAKKEEFTRNEKAKQEDFKRQERAKTEDFARQEKAKQEEHARVLQLEELRNTEAEKQRKHEKEMRLLEIEKLKQERSGVVPQEDLTSE